MATAFSVWSGGIWFLNPKASEFFVNWHDVANDVIGVLHAEVGRDPSDKRLSDLIGELSTRSEEFRVPWAAHDVKLHRAGTKRFQHPVVGDLTLSLLCDGAEPVLDVPAEDDPVLRSCHA